MRLEGYGIGRGFAVGPILRMPDAAPASDPGVAPNAEAVLAALGAVADDLETRGARAGGEAREVLAATALMAKDPVLVADILDRVGNGEGGETAVSGALEVFAEAFTAVGGRTAERATDLRDLARRVIARLRGIEVPGVPNADYPYILVADDLAPADTAVLDPAMVIAIVIGGGGPTSHTAIIARAKGIPAIVSVESLHQLNDGTIVLVDAATGTVHVAPTATEIAEVRGRSEVHTASGPGSRGALADGTMIPLLANLGSAGEADEAIAHGAEGVGLVRTELLFLAATEAPTVAEQRARYTELLKRFPSQTVVVRVFDAGTDKPLSFLPQASEPNPALGSRGLRSLRANEPILRDQLAALAASQQETTAELWVMAPMVADVEDTEYFVALARELGLRTVGVTAEVPSIALLAERVVRVADFVSIGTNDLVQYTLAADRQLGSVARYQDPWHPAVLRLVKLLGDAGATSGTPVGICGEAAGDPALAIVLVGLGATTLSMSPGALDDVRAALATVTLEQARARAAAALATGSAVEARTAAMAAAAKA